MSEAARMPDVVARTRRAVGGAMAVLGWWAVCGCIAACALILFTASVAGFDLDHFARLQGSFWTHFAKASPEQRAPVLRVLGWSYAGAVLLVAWLRAPRRTAKPLTESCP